MTNDPAIKMLAEKVETWTGVIDGVGGTVQPQESMTVWVSHAGSPTDGVMVRIFYVEDGKPPNTIISTPCLECKGVLYKATPEWSVEWPGGSVTAVEKIPSGDAYLAYASFSFGRRTIRGSFGYAINMVKLPHTSDKVMQLAAAFNLGVTGLKKLSGAVKNLPMPTRIDPDLEVLIESNAIRRRALAKMPSAVRLAPKDKTVLPGHSYMMDAWIATPGTKCPLTGATVQIETVDSASLFVLIRASKTRTTDEWKATWLMTLAQAKLNHQEPRMVIIDADSVARSEELDGFRAFLASDEGGGVASRVAAGLRHQTIGLLEVICGDVIERRAEMAVARFDKGHDYIFPARKQMAWTHNRGPTQAGPSPLQMNTGRPLDFEAYADRGGIPIFGAECVYMLGEQARGPKGSETVRSETGRFMYIDERDDTYVLQSGHNAKVTRRKIEPVNQVALMRAGTPAGCAMTDAETQITPEDAPPLTLMTPPPPPVVKSLTKYVTVIDEGEVPQDARVRVWWPRGAVFNEGKWYEGTVMNIERQPDGELQHIVKYDNFAEPTRHNLAGDRANGRLPLVIIPSRAPKTPKPVTVRPPPQRVTRHTVRLATFAESHDDPKGVLEQASFQLLGCVPDEVDKLLMHDELTQALLWLNETEGPTEKQWEQFHVHKARQRSVEVWTPMGMDVIEVPTSDRQVKNDRRSETWVASDHKALQVSIMGLGRNKMVSITIPRQAGADVAESVIERSVKTEVVDGHTVLSKNDPFKSRIALDAARLQAVKNKRGEYNPSKTYSTNAAPITKRAFVSDAAGRRRTLAKGDVKNAYGRADTKRGKRYQRVPEHLREYDEEGHELVIEFEAAPTWGEQPAGYEWDVKFHTVRERLGWRPAESVPGLWVFTEKDLVMVGEVDDFLISEPSETNYYYTALTIYLIDAALRHESSEPKMHPVDTPCVKWAAEPELYAGMELARSEDLARITIRKTAKIENMARNHASAVVDGDKNEIKRIMAETGTNKEFRAALDALAPRPPSEKLSKSVAYGKYITQMQGLVGEMEYVSDVHPENELGRHALARSVCRPPEKAHVLGQRLVIELYENRNRGVTFSSTEGDAWRPMLAPLDVKRVRGDGLDEGHGGASGVTLEAGAPKKTEAHADATWGKLTVALKDGEETPVGGDVFGVVITKHKAAILARTKKIPIIGESSMDNERHATLQVSDDIEFVTEFERATGTLHEEPILVTTDNAANQRVAEGEASAVRSKHALRRYLRIWQRVASGLIYVRHVADEQNPADFLTKWLALPKFKQSVAFVTNAAESVDKTPAALIERATAAMTAALQRIVAEREPPGHAPPSPPPSPPPTEYGDVESPPADEAEPPPVDEEGNELAIANATQDALEFITDWLGTQQTFVEDSDHVDALMVNDRLACINAALQAAAGVHRESILSEGQAALQRIQQFWADAMTAHAHWNHDDVGTGYAPWDDPFDPLDYMY